jgi:hypothetical protein
MAEGYKQEVIEGARREVLSTLEEAITCKLCKITINMNRGKGQIEVVMERHRVIEDDK